MNLAEALPSPPTVHEVLATALADNKRCTLHELERAAALHGHSAMEVELVLRTLVRAGELAKVQVYTVPDTEPEPVGHGEEDSPGLKRRMMRLVEAVKAAPPLQLPEPAAVDHCESAREEVTQIIARVQQNQRKRPGPRSSAPGRVRGKTPFWAELCEVIKALPCGQSHYLVNPECTPGQLMKRTSVQLCNWRTLGQIVGQFRTRTTDRGLLITRLA